MAFTNIYGKDFLRISSLENSLMLGKNESRRRRGRQRMRWLYSITDAMDMNLGKLRKMVRDREVYRVTKSWTDQATEQPTTTARSWVPTNRTSGRGKASPGAKS